METWSFKIARTKQTALLLEAELVKRRQRAEQAAEIALRATAQNTVRIKKKTSSSCEGNGYGFLGLAAKLARADINLVLRALSDFGGNGVCL